MEIHKQTLSGIRSLKHALGFVFNLLAGDATTSTL